jgi:hypothetical protein
MKWSGLQPEIRPDEFGQTPGRRRLAWSWLPGALPPCESYPLCRVAPPAAHCPDKTLLKNRIAPHQIRLFLCLLRAFINKGPMRHLVPRLPPLPLPVVG